MHTTLGNAPLNIRKSIGEQKATGAHFTPAGLAGVLARRLWAECENMQGKDCLRILDPACGDGELLEAIYRMAPERTKSTITLVGVDSNRESIDGARSRLMSRGVKTEFIEGNFLDLIAGEQSNSLFEDEVALPSALASKADIVIANPPYVRTQILGANKAQELAKVFELNGRVDLYHAFVAAMTRQVKPHGLLGVITSNRFLSTKGGASLRELLDREYELVEIMDLGDTKLFDAAVLPAIVIGRKRGAGFRRNIKSKFLKIYECAEPSRLDAIEKHSIYDLLESPQDGRFFAEGKSYDVTVGMLPSLACSSAPWVMQSVKEESWVAAVERSARFRVADIARVRVGIKTTADNVFIRDDWEELKKEIEPEPELLKPLVSSGDVYRWRRANTPDDRLRRILYTHEMIGEKRRVIDLKKYPRAARYLESHRKQLHGRAYVIDAGRAWYEIWVPQNPAAWKLPKIIFPDISPSAKFMYDGERSLVDGNCYWITMDAGANPELLYLILAVANSKLMAQYHDLCFQNKLYAGRKRFLTQYVERYPLPDPTSLAALKLIALSKSLCSEAFVLDEECELESLVAESFSVNPVMANVD